MQHENIGESAARQASAPQLEPIPTLGDSACSIDSPQESAIPSIEPNTSPDSDSEDSESDSDEDAPVRIPRLPYKVGFEFTATPHSPPPPYGGRYTAKPPPQSRHFDRDTLTEYYLDDEPPILDASPAPSQSLKITSIIRVGTGAGAQVVVVNDTMVAKIYDPLYYNDDDEGYDQYALLAAHGDYSREAAAYKQLQTSPAAKEVTPAFHGTWSIKVPSLVSSHGRQKTHIRVVCMILVEYLQGQCMRDVDPHGIHKRIRSCILKKVIHAEAIVFDAGVGHRDCHPRNVILLGRTDDSMNLKVKIIDFNVSGVIELEGDGDRLKELKMLWPDKICSPVVRFYSSMEGFSSNGWCSSKEYEASKWLWRHFKNDEQYYPVKWDPEHPSKRPAYQEEDDNDEEEDDEEEEDEI